MTDTSNLNKIARIVIESFKESGFDDYYINDKIERLEGLTEFQTLFWCSYGLGEEATERFANKINVTVEQLEATFKTIRQIDSK